MAQVARNHQYVRSHVTDQHFSAGRIVETDILVHIIDEMEEITLKDARKLKIQSRLVI